MDIKDEEKSTCDSKCADTTAEVIIKDIFAGCDPEGRGSVRVSDLVNFIRPYFESCPEDLVELSIILDPHSQNPEITNTDFFDKMSKWMEKFSSDFSDSIENGTHRSPQALLNFEKHTTIKQNLAEKMKTMDGGLNESFASNTSVTENKSFLEERINELNYQNKKCGDELSYAKSQLSASEELIESLQKSNEDYKRKLLNIKEMYDSLQKKYQQCDNIREITNNNQQQMERLAKRLSLIEKENVNLKHLNSSMEIEKQQYDQKLVLCQKKLMASEQEALALQMEVAIKDKKLVELEEAKHDLQRKLNETTRISNEYREIYENTLSEKKVLQTELECISRDMSRSHSTSYSEYQSCLDINTTNTSTEDVPFVPAISTNRFHFYNFDSPYARRRSKSHRASLPTRLIYQSDTEIVCNKSLLPEGDGILAPVYTTDRDSQYTALQKREEVTRSLNDSYSDDDTSLHLTNAKISPHESLHDELSKAVAQESSCKCDIRLDQQSLQIKMDSEKIFSQFNDLRSKYDQLEHEKTKLETMIVENNNKVKQLSGCLERIQKDHGVEIQVLIKERDQLELQITQIENDKLKAEENCKDVSGKLETVLEERLQLQSILQKQIAETNMLKDKKERLDRINLDLVKENKHLELTMRMQTEILRTKEMTFELETQELGNCLERMKFEHSKLKLDMSQLEEADMFNKDIICRYEKQVETISHELTKVNLALEMKENDFKFCKDVLEDKIKMYKQKVEELHGHNLQLQDINKKLEDKCKELELPCDILLPLSMADSCTSTSSSGDDNAGLTLVLSESAVLCKKISEIEQHYNRCRHQCSFSLLREISSLRSSLFKSELVRKLGKTQKSGYDRMKIKFERLQEKVDYLEEQLAEQRQRSFQLEEEKRCLEKNCSVISQDTYQDLFESGRLLKRATDNLIQRWNQHNKIDMTTLTSPGHENDDDNYNSLCDSVINTKLFFLNKKILYSITAMNNMAEIAAVSSDTADAPEETFVFPVTSEKLTLRLPHLISRPMSPDSPNLEMEHNTCLPSQTKFGGDIAHGPDSTIETLTIQSYNGAGDFSGDSNLNDTNSTIFEDACVDISVHMIHAFDQFPNDEIRQDMSDADLETKFQELVLGFIIDKSTIEKRVDVQCSKLRQLEVELASTVHTLVKILRQCLNGDHLRRAEELMDHLQRKNCHLTRLVEQFGGIKFERKTMSSMNTIINYVSTLRKKLDQVNEKQQKYTSLHTETVLMDEVIKHNISTSVPMPRSRLNGLRKCLHPTKLFGMFCTMGAFCCVLCILMQCFNMVTDHRPGSMLRSLEDSFWPLLRKEYRNGPPPT